MLSSLVQLPIRKWGAGEKIAQNMLSCMMQFLFEKSAVKNQLRKLCSVAWCDINLEKEEPEKTLAKFAQ